jgi:HEAT repeat protein
MNMRKQNWALSGCVILTLVMGCSGPTKAAPPVVKQIGPPKVPPAVPARKDEPLNTTLRESAKNRIKEAFSSNDPHLRGNSVEAAQNVFGADSHDIVAAAIKDKAAFVRFSGVMAAGRMKFHDLHDDVLALAEDADPRVRIAVRYALHRMGDVHLSHDLEKIAEDPNPRVREDVAFVLGQLGEKSGIKILQYMTTDSDAGVRIQVADSMWRLGDQRGLDVLVAGTVSQFADDRMLCLMGLAGPKDRRVEEHLRGQLTDEYPEVALVAARAMGDIGLDDGYGVCLKYINSTDPRQRQLAATALGSIGRSDAQTILAPLLNDPDQRVRLAAATAILQLKAPGGR